MSDCKPEGKEFEQEWRYAEKRWRRPAMFFLFYTLYAVQALFKDDSIVKAIAGCAVIAIFIGLYLFAVPRGAFSGSRRLRNFALVSMSSILVVYGLVFGEGVIVLLAYFSVSVAILVPVRVAVAWVIVVCPAVLFAPQYVWHDIEGIQYGLALAVTLGALATIGIRRNVSDRIELGQTREELRTLAAEQERVRIARDLHDLLGHALTTVIVKAELAAKLTDRDPQRATQEMNEVAELARQGLADVRSTVAGFRSVSLVTELATAREVLRSAGIEADIPTAADVVPTALREPFGWVLREGVTNAVRHSSASKVTVTLRQNAIEIQDNGKGSESNAGNGLTGLRERLTNVGGVVTAENDSTGGFRLMAEVPA